MWAGDITNKERYRSIYVIYHTLKPLYEALDGRSVVATVFVDLPKTFDIVNHNILVNKLTYVGI